MGILHFDLFHFCNLFIIRQNLYNNTHKNGVVYLHKVVFVPKKKLRNIQHNVFKATKKACSVKIRVLTIEPHSFGHFVKNIISSTTNKGIRMYI